MGSEERPCRMAAHAGGSFYGFGGPSIAIDPPSAAHRREKEEMEQALLSLWP